MTVDARERALQRGLLEWLPVAGRDLPWRHTRDPWAVLVSELMLQQTQVARVEPRYTAFLAAFPTPAVCAAAPAGDVLRAWAGLGYNRRALSLHRAADEIVHRHGGSLPAGRAALEALPGVGPYTARAVLAFAFGAGVGVVETNSARVLARAVAGRALTRSEAQAAADRLVPAGDGWAWNQAVLDLGATVCTRRAPSCGRCPVVSTCAWAGAGRPPPDPAEQPWATSRQSPFAGSDRQGRGRLIDALRRAPLPRADVARAAGWPQAPGRAEKVAAGLVAEGLARIDGDMLRLP